MSVRRAPCAVRRPYFLLSGAFLENRMAYLDDIWYVGGHGVEGAHAEFGRGIYACPLGPQGSKMLNNDL